MPEKIIQSLDGVSETLLMTLYARARETQRPDHLIKDDLAVAMVDQIACDFSRLRMQRHDEITLIMRMNRIDHLVRDFLERNPDAVVVHIGCGLDTRFERVDNGRVEWFDMDLPDVIALRQKLIHTENSRHHDLAASVFETVWMESLRQYLPRPFMFVAEGVLPYFEEDQVKYLFLNLCEQFTGCELVCDVHTPFAIWADNMHLAYVKVKARMKWSVKNGKDVESWKSGIHLISEWTYFEEEDSPLKAYRWMRLFPFLSKSSGIFQFRLGNKQK